MDSDIILVIVVAAALAFDFTNGFHDTANAVATSISTRALAPKTAVTLAAILNFVGAFISLKIAATVASGIVDADLVTTTVIFAGLIGAIFWNLLTWYFGLPSSSSHALIGGVVGAAFAAGGAQAVLTGGLIEKVIVPALVAPVIAFLAAADAILITYRMVGRLRPGPVNRGYRLGQIASASLLSLSHGTSDAQKTMGIITLALVANGTLLGPNPDPPTWVVISAATAIALGTYTGGWRIIRTMGTASSTWIPLADLDIAARADGHRLRQAPAARPGADHVPGRRMTGAIDTGALLELVWAAPLAVLAVTVSWGMVVVARRAPRRPAARTARPRPR